MSVNRSGKPPSIALDRLEFELACIREFAHSGMQLGPNVSREERRERIRAAIWRENKQNQRWRDTPITYAAAYELAYHKPLDGRAGDEAPAEPMALNWPRHPTAESDAAEDEGDLETLE